MCFLERPAHGVPRDHVLPGDGVGRAANAVAEPPIDNDEELAANGVSCIAGAFFRAMPSAGGFSQTAINQRAGAVTQMSEMVTVVLAVCCALFLGGVLSDLPEATLSCMVIIAVLGLHAARRVRALLATRASRSSGSPRSPPSPGCSPACSPPSLVGVLLTLFLVIWELDHVGVTELRPTADGRDLRVVGDGTAAEPGLLVLRIDGPLYTANVHTVNRRILDAVDAPGRTRWCSRCLRSP